MKKYSIILLSSLILVSSSLTILGSEGKKQKKSRGSYAQAAGAAAVPGQHGLATSILTESQLAAVAVASAINATEQKDKQVDVQVTAQPSSPSAKSRPSSPSVDTTPTIGDLVVVDPSAGALPTIVMQNSPRAKSSDSSSSSSSSAGADASSATAKKSSKFDKTLTLGAALLGYKFLGVNLSGKSDATQALELLRNLDDKTQLDTKTQEGEALVSQMVTEVLDRAKASGSCAEIKDLLQQARKHGSKISSISLASVRAHLNDQIGAEVRAVRKAQINAKKVENEKTDKALLSIKDKEEIRALTYQGKASRDDNEPRVVKSSFKTSKLKTSQGALTLKHKVYRKQTRAERITSWMLYDKEYDKDNKKTIITMPIVMSGHTDAPAGEARKAAIAQQQPTQVPAFQAAALARITADQNAEEARLVAERYAKIATSVAAETVAKTEKLKQLNVQQTGKIAAAAPLSAASASSSSAK